MVENGRVADYGFHPERFSLPAHDPRMANAEESQTKPCTALKKAWSDVRDHRFERWRPHVLDAASASMGIRLLRDKLD